MPARPFLVSAPAAEPITLAEAKAYLKWTGSDSGEESLINGWIKGARQVCEDWCDLALITQTWRLKLDGFPGGYGGLELPRVPLQSVSSITYVDTNGVSQTLDSSLYSVDTDRQPGWITPAEDTDWPATDGIINAVTITWVAGYGATSASVPERIRDALFTYILFQQQRGSNPGLLDSFYSLLQPYRFSLVK